MNIRTNNRIKRYIAVVACICSIHSCLSMQTQQPLEKKEPATTSSLSAFLQQPGALATALKKADTDILQPLQNLSPVKQYGLWAAGALTATKVLPHIPYLDTIPKFLHGEYGQPGGIWSTTGKLISSALIDIPLAIGASFLTSLVMQKTFPNMPATINNNIKTAALTSAMIKLTHERWIKSATGTEDEDKRLAAYRATIRNNTEIHQQTKKFNQEKFNLFLKSTAEEPLQKLLADAQSNPTTGGRVLIIGRSNLGKTTWAREAADVLSRDYVYINAQNFDPEVYTGSDDIKWDEFNKITQKLQPGSIVIMDEVDRLLKTINATDQLEKTRKKFMDFLDKKIQEPLILIMLSNSLKDLIHEQVLNRTTRTGSLTKQDNLFVTLGSNIATLTRNLYQLLTQKDPDFKPLTTDSLTTFGWGVVERTIPNELGRMNVVDTTLTIIQNRETIKIDFPEEFSAFIAKRTKGLTHGALNNLVQRIWEKHKEQNARINIKTKLTQDLLQPSMKEIGKEYLQELKKEYKNVRDKNDPKGLATEAELAQEIRKTATLFGVKITGINLQEASKRINAKKNEYYQAIKKLQAGPDLQDLTDIDAIRTKLLNEQDKINKQQATKAIAQRRAKTIQRVLELLAIIQFAPTEDAQDQDQQPQEAAPVLVDEKILTAVKNLYYEYSLSATQQTHESLTTIAQMVAHIPNEAEQRQTILALLGVPGYAQKKVIELVATPLNPIAQRLRSIPAFFDALINKQHTFNSIENILTVFANNGLSSTTKEGETSSPALEALNAYLTNENIPSLAHALAITLKSKQENKTIDNLIPQYQAKTIFFGIDKKLYWINEKTDLELFTEQEKLPELVVKPQEE